MNNINEDAKDYVKSLFAGRKSNKLVANSGTELGNFKSELLEKKGLAYIKRYDLIINKVIHEKLYPNIKA